MRFLSVIVVATPCPLLIAIPVALMGSISLCARRGIIIRDSGVLERLDRCKVIIFDKTGTLTYGKPRMTEVLTEPATDRRELLYLAASLEQYSRHPLASAVLEAAEAAGAGPLAPAQQIDEPSGLGLRGVVGAHSVVIGGRKHIPAEIAAHLPQATSGMECIILKDGRYVGLLRFRDEPRQDLARFITHLTVSHGVRKTMMVTGDGAAEAHRIGKCGGVGEVFYSQSPENKLAVVAQETRNGDTLYIGDGINDAPALAAASVGIAMGAAADVTTAAAGAVILEPSLLKLDELLHIASHLHRVLLQSAVGGIALSAGAMVLAAAGFINPASGAVIQELVDLAAVVNALRTGLPRGPLVDM